MEEYPNSTEAETQIKENGSDQNGWKAYPIPGGGVVGFGVVKAGDVNPFLADQANNPFVFYPPAPHAAAPAPAGTFYMTIGGEGYPPKVNPPPAFTDVRFTAPLNVAAPVPQLVIHNAPAPSIMEPKVSIELSSLHQESGVPARVAEAFKLFTRTDLSPHELQLKMSLVALIERYSDLIDSHRNLNENKS